MLKNSYLKKLELELNNVEKQIKLGVTKPTIKGDVGEIKPTVKADVDEIKPTIKSDVGEIDIPIPKKFVAGDSIEFFDDAGNKVKRKVVSVSSSGRSVKVKLGNEEKVISLDEGASDFINFKNPSYVLRAAGTIHSETSR